MHANRTVCLTMDNYIANLRVKFNHADPRKPQHSPNKRAPIIYCAKLQYAAEADDSSPLDKSGILRVQFIVDELLFYSRAVDNKLLVDLSKLGQKQERTHNVLHAEDASLVKGSAVISFGRVLDFGAVDDWSVFVQGVLRFPGVSVVELYPEVGNVRSCVMASLVASVAEACCWPSSLRDTSRLLSTVRP